MVRRPDGTWWHRNGSPKNSDKVEWYCPASKLREAPNGVKA